jgi:ABC-type multidrug transport system permease subunit
MVLPTFRSLGARRRERNEATTGETANDVANAPANVDGVIGSDRNSERTLTPTYTPVVNIKEATKTRKIWVIISSLLFVICVIFLILVSASFEICQRLHKLMNTRQ